MAISFREYPWYLQALVFVALALVIIGAGEYLPGSPVAAERVSLQQHHSKESDLTREVSELQVYERRNAEFKVEMAALEKQLETLQTIVPEEKEVDDFMRMVQSAAAASGEQIRRINSEAVVPRDYHYELPFTIDVDGPYFAIEDFFARLSHLSRIINVGDLTFTGTDGKAAKYPLRPGSSVTGTCKIITFFTMSAQAAPVAAAATNRAPAPKTAPASH